MKTPDMVGQRADLAARLMAVAGTARKNAALSAMADGLTQNVKALESAWQEDFADRLPPIAAEKTVAALSAELTRLAEENEPIGEVIDGVFLEDSCVLEIVRAPLGAVGVVGDGDVCYMVRAVALLIKTGNAGVFFSEPLSPHTTRLVIDLCRQSLLLAGLPADAIQLAEAVAADEFLALPLMKKMLINGRSPLTPIARGSCRVPLMITDIPRTCFYVAGDADPKTAVSLAVNACTVLPREYALHTLLVHRDLADAVIHPLKEALGSVGITLLGDDEACKAFALSPVADWYTPTPDGLRVRVLSSLNEALAVINVFGSGHVAGILTNEEADARRFAAAVDAAVITVNTAPVFSDGNGLDEPVSVGLCADAARGPVGVDALTTLKRVVSANGQPR